jgi:hypothetical protein
MAERCQSREGRPRLARPARVLMLRQLTLVSPYAARVRGGGIGGMRIGWRSARSARPPRSVSTTSPPSPCGSSPAAAISAASPSVPPAPDASIRRRSSASLGRSQKAATAVARSLNWPAVPRAQADIASSRAAAHWQQARTAMANGSSAFGATLPLRVAPAKDGCPPKNEPALAGGRRRGRCIFGGGGQWVSGKG